MPAMTEERRKELTKVVQGRRRTAPRSRSATCVATPTNTSRKLVKDKLASEDDERRAQEDIQKLTDRMITEVDGSLLPKSRTSWRSDRCFPVHPAVDAHTNCTVAAHHCPSRACGHRDGWQWSLGAAAHLPRVAGHKQGLDALRRTVRACLERRIRVLTVFAFSSENWSRPAEEVSGLMELLVMALTREVPKLQKNGVQLHLPEVEGLSPRLLQGLQKAVQSTAHNDRLVLNVCFNYGGRWDIAQAARRLVEQGRESPRPPFPKPRRWPTWEIRTC
jgi:undecaprenyl diphosphate synthase